MNVEFVFTKGYEVRYISHLDLMRVFERALRRSDLPLAYSNGFNPRIKLAFALPLPVGVEGENEIAYLKLEEQIILEELSGELNKQLPPGMAAKKCREIDSFKKLGASISKAEYSVVFFEDIDREYIQAKLDSEALFYTKKTKKKEKQIDLKQHLFDCTFQDNELNFIVHAGNNMNIRPDEVLSVLQPQLQPYRIIRKHLIEEETPDT